MSDFWVTVFSQEAFWSVILFLITAGTTFIFKKIKVSETTKQAIDDLHSAIAIVEEDIVKGLKHAAADGKLTEDEVKQVRDAAFQKVLEIAKGPAKDLLIAWGKPKIEALITRIVQEKKA